MSKSDGQDNGHQNGLDGNREVSHWKQQKIS